MAENPGSAECADGVPDSDELDGHRDWRCFHTAKSLRPLGCAGLQSLFVTVVDLGQPVVVALCEQADPVDETSEGANGECASAESEEEQLILRLVVVQNRSIELLDVLLDTVAECAAGELVQAAAGAHAIVIDHHLRHVLVITGADGARELRYVGRAALAGLLVALVAFIPRPVGTECNALQWFSRVKPVPPSPRES